MTLINAPGAVYEYEINKYGIDYNACCITMFYLFIFAMNTFNICIKRYYQISENMIGYTSYNLSFLFFKEFLFHFVLYTMDNDDLTEKDECIYVGFA